MKLRQVLILFLLLFFWSKQGMAQHKKVETWYDDKKLILKETYYVISKSPTMLDSLYILYYQNGKVKSKGSFVKNKAEGKWEYYYENGNLKSKGELKGGENNGLWTYYYENGNLNMEGEVFN